MLRLLAEATIMFCVLRYAACCEFTVKELDEKNLLQLTCRCHEPPPGWGTGSRLHNLVINVEKASSRSWLGFVNYNYDKGVVTELEKTYSHITKNISCGFDSQLQHADLQLRFNKTGMSERLRFDCKVDGLNAGDNPTYIILNATSESEKTSAPSSNKFSLPTTEVRGAVNVRKPEVTNHPKEGAPSPVYGEDASTMLLVCLVSVCTVFAISLIIGILLCITIGKRNTTRLSKKKTVMARYDASAGGLATPEVMRQLLTFVASNVIPQTSAPVCHAKYRHRPSPPSVTSLYAVTSPHSEYSNISEISDISVSHPVRGIVFENELSFYSHGNVSCMDEVEMKECSGGVAVQLLPVPQDGRRKANESSFSTSEYLSAVSSYRLSDSTSADFVSAVTSHAPSGLTLNYCGPAESDTSDLNSHRSILNFQSSSSNSESPALTCQSSVMRSESPALNPHSSALNPQSSAISTQSSALASQPLTVNYHPQSVLSSQRSSALNKSHARELSCWQAGRTICDIANLQTTGMAGQEEVSSPVTSLLFAPQQSSAQAWTAPKHSYRSIISTVPKYSRSEMPLPPPPPVN